MHEAETPKRDWQAEFETVDGDARTEIVWEWLEQEKLLSPSIRAAIEAGGSGAVQLLNVIVKSVELNTFAIWANPFLKLLKQLNFTMDDNMCKNVASLYSLAYGPSNIDLKQQYLTTGSLYDRDEKEFTYTVQVFDRVSNSSKLKSYFKDTSKIDISHLYDASNHVKPAGIYDKQVDYKNSKNSSDGSTVRQMLPPKYQSTIYGTVESWSVGGNDNGGKKGTQTPKVNTKNTRSVYKSLEDANRDGKDVTGNTVTVQTKYTYDGKEWVQEK